MTTEPITTADVLNVTRAVHDIAQTMSVTLGSKSSAQLGARRAQSYRAAADFLEAFGKAATPGILRREADRIDPPTVPAEPDLTTADGWYAEADAFGHRRARRVPPQPDAPARALVVSAVVAAGPPTWDRPEWLDPTTGILVTPGPPAPTTAPSAVTARPDRPPAPLTVDDALYRAIAVLGAMCFATLLLTVVGLLVKAAL